MRLHGLAALALMAVSLLLIACGGEPAPATATTQPAATAQPETPRDALNNRLQAGPS